MTRAEFIAAFAEKANLTLAQAHTALQAMVDTIAETMATKQSIAIPGFGSFVVKERSERKGRHPATGAEIVIPASNLPAFKPASQLKATVNPKKL
jgi:DNA-binding protein HU-beta